MPVDGGSGVYRLSLSPQEMKPSYDVIVVGSGYGGGVAAARLARAGQRVCLLERGQELQPGEYPVNEMESAAQVQLDHPGGHDGPDTGLFDLHLNDDISVLVGCGLGGTSLINANVGLAADPRVWEDPRWPEALRGDLAAVEAGADRARRVLGARPYPDASPTLPKLEALGKVAAQIRAPLERPPLYVSFEDGVNAFGVEQKGCILCGDCMTGCNHRAKNTVLMNYLPDAWNHGAELFCEVAVRWVEKVDGGGWRVRYQILDAGRAAWHDEPLAVTAGVVVLAAGTLGTTEVLLRSGQHGLALSDQVGRRFSGNGDVLGFAYNTETVCDSVGFGGHLAPSGAGQEQGGPAPVGPTITGAIRIHDPAAVERGITIEEGSLPGPLGGLLPPALALAARLSGQQLERGAAAMVRENAREVESLLLGPRHGATEHTLVYLGMAFDDGQGVMSLDDDRLRISWPGVGRQDAFERLDQLLHDGSAALGGAFVRDPIWSRQLGQRLITVHPLGGAVMGERAADGVVDHRGEVFDPTTDGEAHRGLYVMDGAMVPMALGLNPSLTIASLAERNAYRLAAERGWVIDESTAPPTVPPGRLRTMGIEFTEVMKGWLSPRSTAAIDPAGYEAAAGEGRDAGASIVFELTIRADDVDAMLSDPDHRASAAGAVDAPSLAAGPLTVTAGRFQCFSTDPDHVDTRNLWYRMTLEADDGHQFHFEGFKVVRDASASQLWPQTTTLYVTVREGPSAVGLVVAQGVMTVHPDDFARQLATMRALHAPSRLAGLEAKARFGRFFAGHLFETYGGMFAGGSGVDPTAPPRTRRSLRAPAPEVHPFSTADGVALRLTRFRGGTKGPVMLTHGLGVSSAIFSLDTVGTNLVEFLVAAGYDVWLLDYRASIDLPAAATEFSGEEVARYDYPAAVANVRRVTGAPSIQVVAHCFGSTTFFMAMLGGLGGVRAAVCSQIGAHVVAPLGTRLKAGLHLPDVLEHLGVRTMTAYAARGEGWRSRLFDDGLRLLPVPEGERCRSEVCHRITFLYGLLYEHANLNALTHETLHEMFGVANVGALDHLTAMVRAKHLVDRGGGEVYLPHVRRLAIPISILHGAANECFLPTSTEQTLDWMGRANGPALYDRRLVPGYGHIDCIIGRNAAADVFPYVLERLERTAVP